MNSFGAPAPCRVLGANDRVRVGFIGVGNRGSQLLGTFMQYPDVKVTALYEVYEPYLQRDRAKVHERILAEIGGNVPKFGETFSGKPETFTDFR